MENIFDSWVVNKPIAHRGLHNNKDIVENSKSSFENAIENNFSIELDVRATKDDVPIIFHDDKLSRLTGAKGYVSNSNYDEIKDLKLLSTDDNILTLEDALKLVDGRVPLLIEIKNNFKVGALEKNVLKLLKDYKGEFAIQSFNYQTVEWFKNNAPHILRGLLASFYIGEKVDFSYRWHSKRLTYVPVCEPHFIHYDIKNLPNRFVKKKEIKKLPLLAYTIKSEKEYYKALKKCDNVVFEGFIPKI